MKLCQRQKSFNIKIKYFTKKNKWYKNHFNVQSFTFTVSNKVVIKAKTHDFNSKNYHDIITVSILYCPGLLEKPSLNLYLIVSMH